MPESEPVTIAVRGKVSGHRAGRVPRRASPRPAQVNRTGWPVDSSTAIHRSPLRVDLVAPAHRQRHRQVHEPPPPAADHHLGAPGHRRVHGGLRQPHAVHAVVGVGRHAADGVAGVDVADGGLDARPARSARSSRARRNGPMSRSLALPEASRAPRCSSSRSCPAPSATTTTALPRSATRCADVLQQPVRPVEREGHLGDQHDVRVAAGQRGVAGDEAGVPAHEPDQPDAVRPSTWPPRARPGSRRWPG